MNRDERHARGLPETHVTLTYFETSTWAHVRLGVRRGGHWIPTGSADFRLPPVDFDSAHTDQLTVARRLLLEVVERIAPIGS